MEDPTKTPTPPPPEEIVKSVAHASKEAKKEVQLDQSIFLSQVQLLLADKRTAFALLRTGVSVSLVPLSIWTVLIATSRLWNVLDVFWLLVVVMLVASALLGLGVYLIVHALKHVVHVERAIGRIRRASTLLEDLLFEERWWREAEPARHKG